MAVTAPEWPPKIQWLTPEQGREIFEDEARRLMGMSGEEFIRRWDAGEFDEIADTSGNLHIMDLTFLIPLARQNG